MDQHSQNAFYHSLQVKAQKHFGQGFSFLVAYTIAKELDSQPGVNPFAPRIKEFSILDRPQQLAISYDYELPFGPGKHFLKSMGNPFLTGLVGGWSVAAIQSYQSGLPISLSSFANLTGQPIRTGIACDNYDPNNPARNRYLNPDAFGLPPAFTLGTVHQLPNVRTCGFVNENISFVKDTRIREGLHLKFRAEFFNIFNRHEWLSGIYTQGVNTDINNPAAFGRYGTACSPFAICSASTDPRFIQLNLNLLF
jgi:hypothetical protein